MGRGATRAHPGLADVLVVGIVLTLLTVMIAPTTVAGTMTLPALPDRGFREDGIVPPTKSAPSTDGASAEAKDALGPGSVPADQNCSPHPPIWIRFNAGPQGLVLVEGTPTYRPGSGVVGGMGTPDDPYVIEGWCIEGSPWDRLPASPNFGTGILLQNTDAHVVIRNVHIERFVTGVWLSGAENVTVEDGTFTHNWDHGLFFSNTSNTKALNSVVAHNGRGGISILDRGAVEVSGNSVTQNAIVGISISAGSVGRVSNNSVTDNERGVSIFSSENTRVVDNVISDSERNGITVRDSDDALLDNNAISASGRWGVRVTGSERPTINANTIDGSEFSGVRIDDALGAALSDNAIRNNSGYGVQLLQAEGAALHRNDLVGNDNGGLWAADAVDPVDARDNWWGDASGPSGDIEDACTGTLADGSGSAIIAGSGDVCFDPWLAAPNPDAGADT